VASCARDPRIGDVELGVVTQAGSLTDSGTTQSPVIQDPVPLVARQLAG
jgi:hypothetical protein